MGDLYQQIVYDSDIVVRELQDQVMNIRMVPIKGTFLPLQRIVRDYCVSSGKKIKLQISGGETELDKNVSNNWVTRTEQPVKNKELWIAIDEARNKLKVVEWKWVKAHNGDPKNEEVDTLAYEAAGGTLKTKKQKLYAVVKGCTPGIYTTWDEAKTQVDGYPGAVYKSFKTEEEAKKWMTRIYLNVPFEEKDRVKSLGAKWDAEKKKWWIGKMIPELENYLG